MDHVAFSLKDRAGHFFRVMRKGAHLLTAGNQRLSVRVGDYLVYLGQRFSNRPFEHFRRKRRFKFTPKRIPQWQQETEEGLFGSRAAAMRPRISDNVFMFVRWDALADWWEGEEEGERSRVPDARMFQQGYFQPAGKEAKYLKWEGPYDSLDVTRLVGTPGFLPEVPGSGRSHFEEQDDPLYRVAMKKTAQEQLENTWFGETDSDDGTVAEDMPHPLSELLACLRAVYWNYQTSHWQSSGNAAYGDHLLFQRLYEGMAKEIDNLAEKVVGYYGEELVNAADQADLHAQFQELFAEIADPFERGVAIEEDLQIRLSEIYDAMTDDGSITLGLDDFLMALASDHDTHIYLLQQRLKEL